MILVVGQPGGWAALKRALPEGEDLRFARVEEITASLVRQLRPSLAVAPLIGDRCDAVEVAQALAASGFGGSFRVVAPPLANLAAVRAEIAEAAEGMDFQMVVLSPRSN